MKSNFLKYAVTTLSISCSLFGFADMDYSDTEKSSDQSEKIITPNASPIIQHGFDVFVTADFIYWTGRLDNIEYSQILDFAGSPSFHSSPKHKMSPGFKAGVGVDLKHDGWDTYFAYTYFHTSAVSKVTNGTSSTVSRNINWLLHFNSMDWELGRNFYISPKLLLRPFMGLKGSWQQQSLSNTGKIFNIQQNPIGTETITQTLPGVYHSSNKEDFWGVGIRTGLNTSWQFNKNWSLFANTALSSLWGQFTLSRVDTTKQILENNTQVTTPVANMERRIHTLRPVMEFDIGARWDYWFLDDDYHIRIQAGWEQQVWFDQNQFLELQNANRYGCLNLQGLTVEFRLDF